jgi:hypothetical protein
MIRSTAKRSAPSTVIVEHDEEGYFVTNVPELRGCHTKSNSLGVLMKRVAASPNTVVWGDETQYDLLTRFSHATDFS